MNLKNPSVVKASFVSFGNLLNSVFGMLFLIAVARTLTPNDFGKYALITSILVAASKFVDFGTNSTYVSKKIQETTQTQNITEVFLFTKIILFIFSYVLSVVVLYLLNSFNLIIAIVFLIGLIAYTINSILFAYFQMKEQFINVVGINFFPAIFKVIVASLILLNVFTINIYQAIMLFSFAVLFSAIFVTKLPKRKLSLKKPSKNTLLKFLKVASPAGISQVITTSWPAIANSMAKVFTSFTNVGIFTIADKIANIFMLVSLSIFTVILPKNARTKKTQKKYDLKETYLFSIGILTMASITYIAANFLIVPIFGEDFANSKELLGILIFASALAAIHSFIENFFYVEEQTFELLKFTVVKVITFVGVSILLVPNLQLVGLSIAQLVSALVGLILISFSTYKRFNF